MCQLFSKKILRWYCLKFKLIVTSILALLALNACFATSVELNSSSLNVEKGDTFSLDLLVKDAPETWVLIMKK